MRGPLQVRGGYITKRREFLVSSAAAAAAGSGWGQRPDQAKLDRIAVMSPCFAPLIKGTARAGNPKATLDLMDLGGMVAERYGIHRMDFQHADFPSAEPAYFGSSSAGWRRPIRR